MHTENIAHRVCKIRVCTRCIDRASREWGKLWTSPVSGMLTSSFLGGDGGSKYSLKLEEIPFKTFFHCLETIDGICW